MTGHHQTIRRMRHRLGLTQTRVAELAGVHNACVSAVERAASAYRSSAHAVRRALLMEAKRIRAAREAERRFRYAREAWATAPDCDAVRAMKAAVIEVARDMLLTGDCEQADQLLEIVPDGERLALLDEVFDIDGA